MVITADSAKPNMRIPMKSMLGMRRMTMSGRNIGADLDRNHFGFEAAQPGDDLQARHQDGREQRSQNADAQRHGETLHRTGAEPEHQGASDESCDVAVQNGTEGALEAG